MSARALLFAYDFPPMPGGIARALGEIARHAGEAMPVSTGVPAWPGPDPAVAVVDRLPLPAERLRTLPGLIRWARRGSDLVRQHRPGFLWAGNIKPAGHVVRWLGRRHGLPYGLLAYGGDLLRLARQVERSPRRRWVARGLFGDARRVIAISEWTRSQVVTLGGRLNLPDLASRCEVLPLGVDASRFHPDAAGTRRSELRRGASHWLLTVCRLVPHKGADRSLEVLAALIGLGFDAALFVAGEGPERAALEGAAARLGVAGRVRWLGRISEEELPALYASADVYLGLSREEGVEAEGFGLSFLEAAASGLPVVAGASGGTGASVAEGVTGYMVPPTDAGIAAERVGRLLADSGLAARLGAAGRARAVSEFGWARVAAALLASGSPAGVPAPGGS